MSRSPGPETPRRVIGGMRAILYVAAVLVFAVGVPLFLLAEDTDRFFAWTIASPLTAAFLGGSYWSACILEFLAARRREWENARVAVPAVITFTALTFGVTLIHSDKFHFDAPEAGTVAGTWLWLAVYALVPVWMAVLWLMQTREPGQDGPRTAPLERWQVSAMAAVAAVMLLLGALLLLAPGEVKGAWPWELTPLTARAIGAWLIGLGIASAQAAREADAERVRPVAAGSIVFVTLQAIGRQALVRARLGPRPGSIVISRSRGAGTRSVLARARVGKWSAFGTKPRPWPHHHHDRDGGECGDSRGRRAPTLRVGGRLESSMDRRVAASCQTDVRSWRGLCRRVRHIPPLSA